jgi:hypothetical protein
MSAIRIVISLAGLVLAALIVWAMMVGNFGAAGTWLTSDPWGIVTLVDLYTGLAITALVIASFERNWTAALWIIPLPFLGNVWTVIWVVLRLPELVRRLKG